MVFLVLNNTSYRVPKLGVRRMGGPWTPSGAYPPGLDIEGPLVDVVGSARAMGVDAERVAQPTELRPALERAFAAGRPYLLDIAIEKTVDQSERRTSPRGLFLKDKPRRWPRRGPCRVDAR